MCVIDMTRAKNPISVITAFLRLTILVVGKQKKSFNWEGGFSRKALTGDSVVVVVFWSVVVFLVAVFLVVFFFSRRSTQSSEAMMMMMMVHGERCSRGFRVYIAPAIRMEDGGKFPSTAASESNNIIASGASNSFMLRVLSSHS